MDELASQSGFLIKHTVNSYFCVFIAYLLREKKPWPRLWITIDKIFATERAPSQLYLSYARFAGKHF